MRIAVAIATTGRRDVLSQSLLYLDRQTRAPDAIYVCPGSEKDIDRDRLKLEGGKVQVVFGKLGLPSQRNEILKVATSEDVIVFFDDDFIPAPEYLFELEALMRADPSVIMATGRVLADGAKGPGLTFEDADRYLAARSADPAGKVIETYGGYGCNMAFRLDVARREGVFFDERLPLYGWWEDIDFSRRLAAFGRIVNSPRLVGVHLGVKLGRSPGLKLGYSQVANLVYMVEKGSISPWVAAVQISKNVGANLIRTPVSEPWVDRWGRLKGNILAIRDMVRGRVAPEVILNMK